MTDLLHDVRYALRGFLHTPAFTVTAVLTLGIGIGANTASFSALDRLLLRTLPVPAAERLVHVVTDRGDDDVNHNQAYPTFAALRAVEDVFAGVLAAAPLEVALRGAGAASRISGSAVSGEYFRVLGVRPALGRFFADGEDRVGDPRFVAVVGHGFWTRTLGGDPAAVGRELRINDRPFTVIGVAPASFTGLERGAEIEVWLPLAAAGEISEAGRYFDLPTTTWLFVMARLGSGVTRAEAEAALAAWDAGRVEAGVQRAGVATRLRDGAGGLTDRADSVATPLTVMMAAVGVLLLIACANVASLRLVRAGGRRRELAVRAALGAGRGRIARQLLIESLLLAGLGGALGLVVATWAAGLLAGYRTPGGAALALATGLDLRVLGFAAVVSLATAVAFGLLPALRASRPDLVAGRRDAGAGPGSGSRRLGLREALVGAQVGLSVVLLVAAALLGRTLRNLERTDVGFDPDGVLAASVDVEALVRRGGRTSDEQPPRCRCGARPGSTRSRPCAMNSWVQGVRWAVRTLAGNPGFTHGRRAHPRAGHRRLAASLAACVVTARRAAGVNPVEVLHDE